MRRVRLRTAGDTSISLLVVDDKLRWPRREVVGAIATEVSLLPEAAAGREKGRALVVVSLVVAGSNHQGTPLG